MRETRAATKISVYDTPDALFEQLALVWPIETGGTHRWINFKAANGCEFTFFGRDVDDTEAA